jgi:hypothetical protein
LALALVESPLSGAKADNNGRPCHRAAAGAAKKSIVFAGPGNENSAYAYFSMPSEPASPFTLLGPLPPASVQLGERPKDHLLKRSNVQNGKSAKGQ